MRALVKKIRGIGISLEDVPKPNMGPNDVLIKINKVSVCGTDLHIYNWDEWAQKNITPPLIIGHEFVGTIADVGADVASFFKVGDRVSGENHIACDHCRNCRAGRAHLCRKNASVGITRDGCFADYLVIPSVNAYPIPANISDDIATILNQFGNSVHTALTYDLVGEDVLITGAGPVGIMAAAVAKHAGARFVVITDVNPYRLKLAEKFGVTMAVNPTTTTLDQVMKQLGMKEGFDVGLEMSGNDHAFSSMINHMNHNGKIALLGFVSKNAGIDWNQIIMKGITIKGIYGRQMYDTWYKMTTMIQSGLDLSPIITHHFDASEYQKVFDMMLEGAAGKIIVDWNA